MNTINKREKGATGCLVEVVALRPIENEGIINCCCDVLVLSRILVVLGVNLMNREKSSISGRLFGKFPFLIDIKSLGLSTYFCGTPQVTFIKSKSALII